MGIGNEEQEMQMGARMLRYGILQKNYQEVKHVRSVNRKKQECSCRSPDLAERGRLTRKDDNATTYLSSLGICPNDGESCTMIKTYIIHW